MLSALLVLGTGALSISGARADAPLPYRQPTLSIEARLSDLFGRLTQDEKLSLLTGTGFATAAIPRLGVPGMEMADAGQGVRGGSNGTQGPASLFPAGVTMASTWDPELIGRVGQAIGEEAVNKGTGVRVLLGPAVNIHRSPLGGRNGEYFSEDPFLAARLAVGYIQGMQSVGCSACIKHYAANNEEVDRDYVNVHVDERALREIYLPAFEAGVKEGHVWSLMSSYNQVNGFHSSANEYLLTNILKHGWGFDGLVMSDWGGVHETAGVVNAGNDLEMPGGDHLKRANLVQALADGKIRQASIDDAARRVLRAVLRVGLLDGSKTPNHALVNSPAHQRLTFEAAANGIVLLKNEGGILPLNPAKVKSIAVIGPRASSWQMGAFGSPYLDPVYSVQPLAGITKRAGNQMTVRYAKGTDIGGGIGNPIPATAFGAGLKGEYFANQNLQGTPTLTRTDPALDLDWNQNAPAAGVPRTHFSARWTGKLIAPRTGKYTFSLRADDGCRLFLGGKQLIDHWVDSNGPAQFATIDMIAGQPYDLRVEYYQGAGDAFLHLNWQLPGTNDFAEAVAAAKQSDVALVFVGSSDEGEGTDRPSMNLPGQQDALIAAVRAANKNTVVILNNGTPCRLTNWVGSVPGLIEAWFPGQEGGNAIAAILFGDRNPSGKLPDTLAARREDYSDYANFPGKNGQINYAEGIYVGYRHFDKTGIAPLFPFGYGLSYTTFRYANLKLSRPTLGGNGPVQATAEITNTGSREGAEVVELYVHDRAPKVDRPIRELKGFRKVSLRPGQTKTVTFTLDGRSLAYCDVPGKQWKADRGVYDVEVGSSSRDIKLRAPLTVTRDYTQAIPGMAPVEVPFTVGAFR